MANRYRLFVVTTSIVLLGWMLGCGGGPAPMSTAHDDAPSIAVALPSVSDVDRFDGFGPSLDDCVNLYNKILYRESLDCCQALWTEHGDEMSTGRKVQLLELMGRTYSTTKNHEDARACYIEILKHDAYWQGPHNFRAYPVDWRNPVLEAYEQMGYTAGRDRGAKNVALLDFVPADVTPDETDFGGAEKALADYVTAYMEESVRSGPGRSLLNVVSYRERGRLVSELAAEFGESSDSPFTKEMVDGAQLARQGRLKRVEAFLQGSITRIGDNIAVAFYMIDVETGVQTAGVTEVGRLDDWAKVLGIALSQCLEIYTGEAILHDDGSGLERLGPMKRAVAALTEYHEALALQEEGKYDEAIERVQTALAMRPQVPEFKQLLDDLNFGRVATAMSDDQLVPGLDLEGR